MREVLHAMMDYYKGEPSYIQHFVKVHAFAKEIALGENLDDKTLETLEIAAYVHDIGIKPAKEKHGSGAGKLQEQEGPPVAKEMLSKLGLSDSIIERVCYLVGHHHTYTDIDGVDYQILVEADFLVNFYEGKTDKERIEKVYNDIFKTESGKAMCRVMFLA